MDSEAFRGIRNIRKFAGADLGAAAPEVIAREIDVLLASPTIFARSGHF